MKRTVYLHTETSVLILIYKAFGSRTKFVNFIKAVRNKLIYNNIITLSY